MLCEAAASLHSAAADLTLASVIGGSRGVAVNSAVSHFAVAEDLVDRAVLVELDGDVAALWQTLIEGDAAPLARRTINFELTEESLRELLAAPPGPDSSGPSPLSSATASTEAASSRTGRAPCVSASAAPALAHGGTQRPCESEF